MEANSKNCPFPALQQLSVTVLDVDSNSDLTCNVYVTGAVLGGEEEGVAGAAPEIEVEEVVALKGGGGE